MVDDSRERIHIEGRLLSLETPLIIHLKRGAFSRPNPLLYSPQVHGADDGGGNRSHDPMVYLPTESSNMLMIFPLQREYDESSSCQDQRVDHGHQSCHTKSRDEMNVL